MNMIKERGDNIKKKLNRLLAFCLVLILLSGCASSDPGASTESVTVHTTEAAETPEESTETPTESGEPVSYITGSKTLETLVPALWGRMLQCAGIPSINTLDYDDWNQAREVYMQKYIDDEYELEVYLTRITVFKGAFMQMYTFYDDYGKGIHWGWKDRDENNSILTITPDLYPEAEKYWGGISSSTDELPHYSTNEVVASYIAPAKLKVSGTIRKVSYEKGRSWFWGMTTETAPMWGSVIREAGYMYLEQNGTVLGSLNGEAFLMEIDIETMIGTFWICPDGSDPVKVIFTFDEDCSQYETQIIENAVFTETEKENAWLSMEYDLVTEHLKE